MYQIHLLLAINLLENSIEKREESQEERYFRDAWEFSKEIEASFQQLNKKQDHFNYCKERNSKEKNFVPYFCNS